MIKRGLVVIILLLLNIAIAISVDYPTHSTLYTNEIKPVSDPPIGSNITASTTVTINAAGKITRFNYNGDYLDVDLGKFIVKSDGKVGIGTTSPATKLDVNGQVRTGTGGGLANGLLVQPNVVLPGAYSNLYAVSSADETLVLQSYMGKPLSLNPGGNNVGIGTTSPGSYKLSVIGSQYIGGQFDVIGGISAGSYAGVNTPPSNGMIISGSVGIGTSNPTAPLDVVGPPTGNGITIRASGGGDVVLNPGGSLFFDGVYSYGGGNYIRPVAPNTQTFVTSGAERMRITSGGNVGIGTTTPTQKLDVVGYVKGTGLCIGNDCKIAWPSGGTSQWTTVGTSVYYNSGNVGIGTASPYGALHVSGPQGTGSWIYFGGNAGGALTPNPSFTTGIAMAWNPSNGEGESVIAYGTGAGYAPKLAFSSWNGATLSRVMALNYNGNVGIGAASGNSRLSVIGGGVTIGSSFLGATAPDGNLLISGNVGIGTTTPTNQLDVAGTIGASSNINAGGKVKASNIGTTFTRWGRNDCPTGTTLVYDGYAAGGHASHGGGATALCLSKSPTWDVYNDGAQGGNFIYGTEFETNIYGISTMVGLHDYEAQCAVCLEDDATMTLMVPGTRTCPGGWASQYGGYLMSSNYYGQARSDTVCVDWNSQATGSVVSQDGHLWYPTEAECGSLPCPPYVQNREVTCVVCTK